MKMMVVIPYPLFPILFELSCCFGYLNNLRVTEVKVGEIVPPVSCEDHYSFPGDGVVAYVVEMCTKVESIYP